MKKNIVSATQFLTLMVILTLSACTAIRPSTTLVGFESNAQLERFGYESYAEVLSEHVNDLGFVDYQRLQAHPENLEKFYAKLAAFSPDSHPSLFPSEEDRLAYWINAYNGTVLKGIVQYYPISSVEDVKEPSLLFFFPSKSGFFFFQQFTYGGAETNLYSLEHSVIRKRFADPRFHFALNCASRGCPQLPNTPFYPETLDQQLNSEARRFINDDKYVRFDGENNILYLSSIFDWYEEDFISWLRFKNVDQPSLLAYIAIFAAPHLQSHLQSVPKPEIKFLNYDWGLNDQKFQ